MADTKLSDLTAATDLTSANLYGEQSATSKKFPASLFVPGALSTLTYSATTDIAFTTAPQRRSLTLTGNITFTGSGYADGEEVVVFVNGDSVLRTLAFPSGWVFIGSKPADIAANKKGVLSLQCLGSTEADVRAAWGVQS